ncbi:MAG: 3'(2'),5'-bisphosphate nucleotidase CysQ [Gammaproteobacteria bacterium]|nr:3'(2'),5'-bisphosphate nucleotidase CysQ [Gammaproteobacteria bacterium]
MNLTLDRALLQQVLAIAEAAGEAIRAIYEHPDKVAVITKSDDSPVTAADHAAHAIIVERLTQLTPDIPVLSEESDMPTFEVRRQWTRYWLVDPLDGTKEFIEGSGEFTVNIALIEQHQPVLGVVTVPVKDLAYVAVKGTGAFRIEQGQWQLIRVRPVPDKRLAIVGSRRHGAEKLQPVLTRIENSGFQVEMANMGSSLKFCLIAEGKADCYPRLGPTSEWDTAAAQAVLLEAGGCVVDTKFVALQYNRKESLLNPEFLALGDPAFDWPRYLQIG